MVVGVAKRLTLVGTPILQAIGVCQLPQNLDLVTLFPFKRPFLPRWFCHRGGKHMGDGLSAIGIVAHCVPPEPSNITD
jgi:hypothetical protein